MNIEPNQPTRKAPADWFSGDVYIDAIHTRKPGPSRMACGCVHITPAPAPARARRRSPKTGDKRSRTIHRELSERERNG